MSHEPLDTRVIRPDCSLKTPVERQLHGSRLTVDLTIDSLDGSNRRELKVRAGSTSVFEQTSQSVEEVLLVGSVACLCCASE